MKPTFRPHVRAPRRRTIRTLHRQNMRRPELAYPYISAFPVCIRPHAKQGLHHNRDKVAAGPPTMLYLPARPLAQFADRRRGHVRPGSAPRSRCCQRMMPRRSVGSVKAAEAGDAPGMYNLGVMYKNGGGGLPKDEAQAVRWYQKAAEAGDTDALQA